LRYVAEQITLNLPLAGKASALWSGDAGRRLVFALLLGACASLALLTPPVGSRLSVALPFALMLAIAWSALGQPPFERLPWLPTEGRGLATQFQSAALIVLTPLVLVGYALLVVTATVALETPRGPRLGRWLTAAWTLQTAALALGAWALERGATLPWRMPFSVWLGALLWAITTVTLLDRRVRPHIPRVHAVLLALAAALTAIGACARFYRTVHNVSLGQGASTTLRDAYGVSWNFAQQGISTFRAGHREVIAVALEATRTPGRQRTLLASERSQYVDSRDEEIGEPVVSAPVRRALLQDVSVRLVRPLPNNSAELRIVFTPLGVWLWVGCALLVVGGIAVWVASFRSDA
jgi:cytochrome c biogenesis factor